MIELRRLQALRELARCGTIAAAADALHLTPSAVSQQLAALEQEVGQRLLEPNGRSVRLTPAAETVLGHAEAVFSEFERMDATLATLAAGDRGRVRIASFATAITGIVAPAVARLRDQDLEIELVVQDVEAPESFDLLSRGEVDLVISMESERVPSRSDGRFTRSELARDVLDLALPAEHRLARRREVPLTAFASERFVSPPLASACDDVVRAACAAAGFTPAVAHRSADWSAVMALVGAGLGVACVPRLAQGEVPAGVVIRKIAGQSPCRHLFVACRRGGEDHPLLRAVTDALRAVSPSKREGGPVERLGQPASQTLSRPAPA